jgi:hypothetical protein
VAKVERVGKEAAGWVFHHVLKPAEILGGDLGLDI